MKDKKVLKKLAELEDLSREVWRRGQEIIAAVEGLTADIDRLDKAIDDWHDEIMQKNI